MTDVPWTHIGMKRRFKKIGNCALGSITFHCTVAARYFYDLTSPAGGFDPHTLMTLMRNHPSLCLRHFVSSGLGFPFADGMVSNDRRIVPHETSQPHFHAVSRQEKDALWRI
jgi:hypothetical protein